MAASLKNEALKLFQQAVREAFSGVSFPVDIKWPNVDHPPQVEMGQLAIPCHAFSKILRKSPQDIATAVAKVLEPAAWLERVEVLAGYLNFHVRFAVLAEELARPSVSQYDGKKAFKKIIVEYSQPNTHKIIHVGHLRNAIYGEAICKLLEKQGHTVVRATYPGDLGAHIAKCLWYIKSHKPKSNWPKERRADWLGRVYAEADAYLKNLPEPQEKAAKAEIGQALTALESKSGDYYALYRETREWSLDHMKAIYTWLGIKFDTWYFESECDAPSRELVKKALKQGKLVESEGAVGLDLKDENLGFALLLKSDGTGLYLTKDLELMRQKFADPSVDQSIYVVDVRQKLHFKQLFRAAQHLGFEKAASCLHLSYESVVDADGKPFSSREVGTSSFEELRDKLRELVVRDYLSIAAAKAEWPESEKNETADKIVVGALKYGFLKVDPNKVSKFILEDWIRVEGETGPYLQYTVARCLAILRKVGHAPKGTLASSKEKIEREILAHLMRFDTMCAQAAEEFRPDIVCAWLFDLGKFFNRFYKENPIRDEKDEFLKQGRLALVDLVRSYMIKGMDLIGISAPERL